jgi:putative flippase GtrA
MMYSETTGQAGTLLRFTAVGLLTACLYILLLFLSVETAGLAPFVGAAIAYILAIGFNYFMHYIWTYRTKLPHRVTARRYIAMIVVMLAVNVAATAILPPLLNISYGYVQILLMAAAAAATFVTLTKWVFSRSAN